MLSHIRQYPVRYYALVVAAISLATSFGLDLTTDQVGAVTGFAAAALALVAEKFTVPVDKYEALRQHPSSQ